MIDYGDCLNIVEVRFPTYEGNFENKNKKYSYANYLEGVSSGDYLIVKVGYDFKVVKCVGIVKKEDCVVSVTNMIVGFADLKKYFAKQEALVRKAELKKIMDSKIKKIKDQMVYEMFAKDDEEMAKYLEEFKAL